MVLNILDEIFVDLTKTKEFLLENEILPEFIICEACSGRAAMVITRTNRTPKLIYRCCIRGCQTRKSISSSKLSLEVYLHLFFLILIDLNYKQLYFSHGISSATVSKIKKQFQFACEKFMERRPVLLGGPNVVVEADETVLSRRGIIRSPTSTDDNQRETVWIVGLVDLTNSKNFFLQRVPNRTINTLTRTFEGVISIGSLLHTDGYPTYPSVAENLCISHRVVNHSRSFVAEDGTHTNNIEGFWAHLKSSMRKENGVKRSNIDNWLKLYTFRRRYVMHADRIELVELYIELLKIIFQLD